MTDDPKISKDEWSRSRLIHIVEENIFEVTRCRFSICIALFVQIISIQYIISSDSKGLWLICSSTPHHSSFRDHLQNKCSYHHHHHHHHDHDHDHDRHHNCHTECVFMWKLSYSSDGTFPIQVVIFSQTSQILEFNSFGI